MNNLQRLIAVLCLFLAANLFAETISVGTLNCYLCFDPAVPHQGQLDEKHPLTPDQFATKLENLASLFSGTQFVALQEIGGKEELTRLAETAHMEWAFAKGKDSYTGEEVGAVYSMPGWKVVSDGRISRLDKVVSKHLLVTATKAGKRVRFLVVHLIRPIGQNAAKHQRQLDEISDWVREENRLEPQTAIVVLGDTNDATVNTTTSLLGIGSEAGALSDYSPTHLVGKPFDRMILIGTGAWKNGDISRPPYGRKPNQLQKALWTDHYFLHGTIEIP